MMGHYRNQPGGMGGMSENIAASSQPVALEDVVVFGNRAQRRWAKKKLAAISSHNKDRPPKGSGHGER